MLTRGQLDYISFLQILARRQKTHRFHVDWAAVAEIFLYQAIFDVAREVRRNLII